jgi:lipase
VGGERRPLGRQLAAVYRSFDVPVDGGALRVGQWGGEGPVVLAAHGITANHLSWAAVGQELERSGLRLLAPDLRGRGRSAALPGPFGAAAHACDLLAVLDAAGEEQAIAVGHSLGGFVVSVAAARCPDRIGRTVLVDGGLPLPVPEGLDVDTLLQTVIGPAMTRLEMTFPSREAYREFWQAHPALKAADEQIWGYLDYDLCGMEPALRSSVSKRAVRDDAPDTLAADAIRATLSGLPAAPVLLRAERGFFDDEPLYSDEYVAGWPQVSHRGAIAGTNHYTILFAPSGVEAIAAEVQAAAGVDSAGSGIQRVVG